MGKTMTIRLCYVFKHVQFQIYPPLNIITVLIWLTVKFYYSLIGSTVNILNVISISYQLSNAVSIATTRINRCTRATGDLSLFL
jgi:hypothetical protein